MGSQTEKSVSLILISFLGLFLELTFIRWLPANVLSLAYFTNIVLISSFFGLGIGCILAARTKDLFKWFPVVLLAIISIFISLKFFEVLFPAGSGDWVWLSYKIEAAKFKIGILPVLTIIYILNSLIFVFIGQKVGILMASFQSTKAYTLDLLGSIAGIVCFSLLSFVGNNAIGPVIWFVLVGFISLWFLKDDKPFFLVGVGCLIMIVLFIQLNSYGELWSPYYKIQTRHYDTKTSSIDVFVNGFFHQRAVDLKNEPKIKETYSLPYQLKKPKSVLILGAGTGNDVATAEINDVKDIDAVEIDEAISDLGKRIHPADPYSKSNVHLYIDDARSFLKKNNKKYDMIVMGTLDSHVLLSAMSTVRLDNFIYTKESLENIKAHLNDDGMVVMMFWVAAPWLGDKLLKTTLDVFNEPRPVAYLQVPSLFNTMILAGPGLNKIKSDKSLASKFSNFKPISLEGSSSVEIPTDDWPYLYLSKRVIPDYYVQAITLLVILSAFVLFTFTFSSGKNLTLESLNFFSLGSAFLLLETKSVTTLSLLFGSTWLVNAFVFGAILLMILCANLLVAKFKFEKIEIFYAFLFGSLLLNYFLPPGYFLDYGFWTRSILSSMIIALPIFFAGIIFSSHLKIVKNMSMIYGFNLIGAVSGGFLEYSSMVVGLNKLYIFAGAMYLLSLISFRISKE